MTYWTKLKQLFVACIATSCAVASAWALIPLGGSGGHYYTTFPSTENPIVQDGGWVRGGSEGLDWTDPQTTGGTPGFVWPTMTTFDGVHYLDSIAVRKGFSANQYIRAVVRNTGASSGEEIELITRATISAHSAQGYEVDGVFAGPRIDLVRWNGANGNFTQVATVSTSACFINGSLWEVWTIGSVITVDCNGTQVLQVDVQAFAMSNGGAYFSTGGPGIGLWNQTGSPNSNLAWSNWYASDYH